MKPSILRAAILAASVAAGTSAFAQAYPSRPITLVIPYAAGGTTDSLGRITAEYLGRELGQSLVVENRSGGGAIIGTNAVAKAANDGYTLFFADSAPIILVPNMKADLPYDIQRDFTPVGLIATSPTIFVSNPKSNINSMADLIKAAKERPNTVKYGTGGVGSANHVLGLMLEDRAGIKWVHVPYRSGNQSVQDTVSGQIDVAITAPSSSQQFFDTGQLVPFAITTKTRSPVFPKIPTVIETGFPGFEGMGWFAILGPKDLPKDVTDKLKTSLQRLASSEEYTKKLATIGGETSILVGDDFAKFLAGENARVKPIIQGANLKLD